MQFSKIVVALTAVGLTLVYADTSGQLTEADSKDNSEGCECYLVSGSNPGYFQYHRFWDFRNLSDGSDGNNYTSPPALVSASQDSGDELISSTYFNTTSFNADWTILTGVIRDQNSVRTINSAQNIFISRQLNSDNSNSTFLALRASRLPDFVSSCELDSNQKNVFHSSIRTRLRVVPILPTESNVYVDNGIPAEAIVDVNSTHPVAPGAVVGFFTYESDTQESDIEILTSDPTTNIRYSNQPDYDAKSGNSVPGASTDTLLPNDKVWTDWHDHRIDWYKGVSRWYVDDELVLEKTLNVPTKPSELILNLWSDGGSWSGNMTNGAQVVVGFQWIEMAFNISGKNSGSKVKRKEQPCSVACNVDGVQDVGFPQVAFNLTSNNGGTGGRSAQAASSLVVHLMVFWWIVSFWGDI